MKKLPEREARSTGKPHTNAAIFEASEELMEGQGALMELVKRFAAMAAQVQAQLQRTQELLMQAAQPPRVALA